MTNRTDPEDGLIDPVTAVPAGHWRQAANAMLNKCYSKIWVVTNPTAFSTLADICFQADAHNLELQFKGGLSWVDVVGFYISEKAAKEAATNLISWAQPNRRRMGDDEFAARVAQEDEARQAIADEEAYSRGL